MEACGMCSSVSWPLPSALFVRSSVLLHVTVAAAPLQPNICQKQPERGEACLAPSLEGVLVRSAEGQN